MNQIKTNQTNHWKVICQNALHWYMEWRQIIFIKAPGDISWYTYISIITVGFMSNQNIE